MGQKIDNCAGFMKLFEIECFFAFSKGYPHTVGHWLKTFVEEHHFRYVSCHGLRHTYCSLLLSQNVPIQTVSKYMGHSDSTVTLKVYSHFIPVTQDRVLNALAKLAV